jgi:hypothetical protein
MFNWPLRLALINDYKCGCCCLTDQRTNVFVGWGVGWIAIWEDGHRVQLGGFHVTTVVSSEVQLRLSMDWFKGKFTGKAPYLMGKSMVSCRFSLKPIHWTYPFTSSNVISWSRSWHMSHGRPGLRVVVLHITLLATNQPPTGRRNQWRTHHHHRRRKGLVWTTGNTP